MVTANMEVGRLAIDRLSGTPVVKVVAVDAPEREAAGRTGFLAGRIAVPDDFDRMGAGEITTMFGGAE